MTTLEFDDRGLLPPGDHPMSLDQIRRSILITGPTSRPAWNRVWRSHLLDNLQVIAGQLCRVGVRDIFLAGSFVEARDEPDDIDGYFVCDREAFKTRALHDALNALDPLRSWTWRDEHRRPDDAGNLRLPLWHNYRVELFPYYGQPHCGRQDRQGREVDLPTLYRRMRHTHLPKGIIRLVPDPNFSPVRTVVGPALRPFGPMGLIRRK